MNRREFLQFLGVSGVVSTLPLKLNALTTSFPLKFLSASVEDKLLLASGLEYKVLMRWGDTINATQKFGFNNDFLAFHPLEKNRGILWVNHEYVNSLFIKGTERTKENVDAERLEVGGTLIEIKKVRNDWVLVQDSKFTSRLDSYY